MTTDQRAPATATPDSPVTAQMMIGGESVDAADGQTFEIVNPATGKVKAWIDMSGLPETLGPPNPDAVLNGIAYDREHDRLFVTGKDWPHLYEIRLTPAKARVH